MGFVVTANGYSGTSSDGLYDLNDNRNLDAFSPSTIAAEIAGLVCAADIATKNADSISANAYLAKADKWQQSVANWMFTTMGPLGDGRYYFRIDTL